MNNAGSVLAKIQTRKQYLGAKNRLNLTSKYYVYE